MNFLSVTIGLALMGAAAAGSAAQGDWVDTREPTARSAEEQAFVLDQMRLFLASIAEIQEDLAKGDMAKVAADAAPRGAKLSAKIVKPPHLAEKESEVWRQLMKSARLGFDEIADKAGAGAGKDETLALLGKTMTNCVACHQTYRIVVSEK